LEPSYQDDAERTLLVGAAAVRRLPHCLYHKAFLNAPGTLAQTPENAAAPPTQSISALGKPVASVFPGWLARILGCARLRLAWPAKKRAFPALE
jgi:hypothetical protein